jgi:hypothetical protein
LNRKTEESAFENLINSVEAYNDTPSILCELSKSNDKFFWYASGESKKLTKGDYNDEE